MQGSMAPSMLSDKEKAELNKEENDLCMPDAAGKNNGMESCTQDDSSALLQLQMKIDPSMAELVTAEELTEKTNRTVESVITREVKELVNINELIEDELKKSKQNLKYWKQSLKEAKQEVTELYLEWRNERWRVRDEYDHCKKVAKHSDWLQDERCARFKAKEPEVYLFMTLGEIEKKGAMKALPRRNAMRLGRGDRNYIQDKRQEMREQEAEEDEEEEEEEDPFDFDVARDRGEAMAGSERPVFENEEEPPPQTPKKVNAFKEFYNSYLNPAKGIKKIANKWNKWRDIQGGFAACQEDPECVLRNCRLLVLQDVNAKYDKGRQSLSQARTEYWKAQFQVKIVPKIIKLLKPFMHLVVRGVKLKDGEEKGSKPLGHRLAEECQLDEINSASVMKMYVTAVLDNQVWPLLDDQFEVLTSLVEKSILHLFEPVRHVLSVAVGSVPFVGGVLAGLSNVLMTGIQVLFKNSVVRALKAIRKEY